MTPESQRIAIAEACGKRVLWSCGNEDKDHDIISSDINSIGAWAQYCRRCDAHRVCSIHGHDRFWSISEDSERLEDIKAPDYLNDLNAMREVMMSLSDNQRDLVNLKLQEITAGNFDHSETYDMDAAINATAAQRAEAFLRTIGKWQDSPHP